MSVAATVRFLSEYGNGKLYQNKNLGAASEQPLYCK